MGFFNKALQAAMPKMIGNPLSVATAMVSFALSVVKGQKAKKATKGKKKTTVRKSKILSKKQKQQMEVMERICQSAYGTYIRGATTVAARYIGHPAVAIPVSEMVKTMMEKNAPTVNYLVQLKAEPKKESNIKEEKKPRIDKHTNGRFEYMKGSTKGWFTGFTKAIKGEQVIDEKYTLENLFSGNLTVEDMPDFPEYMTMAGATIGAKYRGLWNSAKGTYDGVKMLVTEPEKVLEVASDAILDFIEDPWESTKEFVGNIRDDVVDAVWRSTPQEISEDAGEILGDVLTGIATGGGGKAAAGGAKMAGNKLLALGKTGAKEFAEGLGDLGKIGAKNVAYVGATTGMENASKNAFRNRLMMMASETGDKAKKVTGIAEGAVSKVDDATKMAGKTGSVANNVTSTTGELIENAVIGTPIVEGSKKAGKIVKDEVVDNAENKIERKITQETVENKVVRGESGKGKGDGVGTSGAVNQTEVKNIKNTLDSNIDMKNENLYNTIGEYTGGRTEEELKLLEYDPAKKAITEGSKNEAKIGLDLEERGIISRLERSSDPKAEFIDISNGKKYDVKSFESNPIGANGIPITSPRKGAFKVENAMKNIIKEFEKNGNDIVIIDKSKLTLEHINQLKEAINKAEIANKIIWWPE